MIDNCLDELINEPTHFRNTPTCIDLIFTDQSNSFVNSGTLHSLIPSCHHNIIYGTLNFSAPSPPPYKRKLWLFNRANTSEINAELASIDWVEKFNNVNVNEMTESFNSTFLRIMDKHIPNKVVTIRDKDAPWITNTIKNKIKRKFKTYKKWKDTDDITYKNKFKQMQSDINLLIKEAKAKYNQDTCHKLSQPDNEHIFWSTFKRLTNSKK